MVTVPRRSTSRRPRTIVHVDLDAFYVGVELARRPELRGLPVVVAGSPKGRGVVLSASYEARKFGLDSGMPSARALRLCPEATFVTPDFRAYQAASREFMVVLNDFSPVVEPTSLDEAYLDYTGCEPLHGPVRVAVEVLRERVVARTGLSASVGVGPSRVVAKVASAAAKPDGVLIVEAGQEAEFLAPLPIRKLPGIGPKAQTALEQLGVKTLGQVAALSEAFLVQRFGPHGPSLRLRSLGIDAGDVHEGRPVNRSISKSSTFAEDSRDPAWLRDVLRRHAEGVAFEARSRGLCGRTVTLRIRFADFASVTRSHTLPQPTASAAVIFPAADALLTAELDRDPRALRLVGVALSNLVDGAQLDLFGDEQERNALDQSLDALRRRYGDRAIARGVRTIDSRWGQPSD
jgi:DNA polymerase IV